MNKNAKLLYATSITYPSILANRIQTLEMSKEFSKQLGFDNFILGGRDIIEQEKINVKNIRGSMKSYFLALKLYLEQVVLLLRYYLKKIVFIINH